MYSPKIKEKLIPQLYIIARELRLPMTRLVNGIIEEYLQNGEQSRSLIVHSLLENGKVKSKKG